MKLKKVYLNSKQLEFGKSMQPFRTWIGGRGSGKSVMIGVSQRQKMGDLPRAKFFFSSSTYTQLLTKTLPPITKIWGEFGLIEHIPGIQNGHYVIGKVPPRNWTSPLDKPRKYTNVITFLNGYTIELLSMDRPEIARGGSYDGGEIDEAALVKQEVLSQILQPSIRGNVNWFAHPSHQQLSLYSSMPWRASGLYLLEYEDWAKTKPELYFYLESTAWDNVKILGERSLELMKDSMLPSIYEIEIMNKRSGRSEICFYYNFNDERHVYDPKHDYEEDDLFGIKFRGYLDVIASQMLELSFDFSGWFTGFTVWQEDMIKQTEHMRDAFYVSQDKGINQVVDAFCEKYRTHQYKYVRIWGEPRGHDKNATGFTYYEMVEQRLKHHGWAIEIAVTSAVSDTHENRYEVINQFFAEDNPILPKIRINGETCKDVIIAINNTEKTPDFKKDKKNERNRSFNQAHATHYTDTIDYYIMQKHGVKVHMYGGSVMGNSVMM
jgi:hypothetical protein